MRKILFLITIFFTLTIPAFAYNGDVSINTKQIRFSNDSFLEGRQVRIYATVSSNSDLDLLGAVRFFDNGNQIGGDQAISIFSHKTDDVFIDWIPEFGTHKIAVKIYPWQPELDDPINNWIVTEVFALQDTDHDGNPNNTDLDDDRDNVEDTLDAFPLDPSEQYDTDGDGIGDNTDKDDDNDGVPDEFDEMPLDPNETMDTDHDGIGNIADTDDDGDGISDTEEEKIGTDPIKTDTDTDGSPDNKDAFPTDPSEQTDTDNDKIGNNTDTDDDNDGVTDENDSFPLNKPPKIVINDNPENTENETLTVDWLTPVTFDASKSYDEDGEIVSYLWELDKKEKIEGNSITETFQKKGLHSIKLTVKDNNGESKSTNFQAKVTNLDLYKQISATLLSILLALLIYFKYISNTKNSEEQGK